MKTIIVTRHQPLVDLIRERHPELLDGSPEVIAHVTDPSILDGAHVIGVLPMHLAARCARVTEIPMALTPADREAMTRGDLSLERTREVAGAPVTYVVRPQITARRALADMARAVGDSPFDWSMGTDIPAQAMWSRAVDSLSGYGRPPSTRDLSYGGAHTGAAALGALLNAAREAGFSESSLKEAERDIMYHMTA